jgi:mannose-6-phosphate isomerase
MAMKRHNSFGKTEMWYIMQADPGAELIVGFNRMVDKDIYLKHLNEKKLMAILNTEPVKPSDVFLLPAKRVHAIGAGILLAEIQQTSDITYRIYDFDRMETNGQYRELHTDLALDAIDYKHYPEYRTRYILQDNVPSVLVESPYFRTAKISLNKEIARDIVRLDSFVIYMCVKGQCDLDYDDSQRITLTKGECILVPASLVQYTLIPSPVAELLEVYIPGEKEEDE